MTSAAWEVIHGDCRDVMAAMEADSVDAIVSDPPYGLSFMGKGWDHAVPGVEFWAEALRVAKPGAHLVAFGGTRTYHRLTCAIEDAGWEIRDCLSWLYGSGFPKSHNGPWGGTALKPAWEPIVLARKPLIGTVAANVAEHGTGGLNIDGCRIGTDAGWSYPNGRGGQGWHGRESLPTDLTVPKKAEAGRWPANVALDEEAAAMLDEQSGDKCGGGRFTTGGAGYDDAGRGNTFGGGFRGASTRGMPSLDTGGASRFFYCAKASRAERERGLEGAPTLEVSRYGEQGQGPSPQQTPREPKAAANHHPTVKPVALMRWLCRLVTPPGGLVLDPFTGSGTTGCAAVAEGFRFVGAELNPEYAEIARRRIAAAIPEPTLEGIAA